MTHIQNNKEITKKVDVLFVLDTSTSLDEEKIKIVNSLNSFIENMPLMRT